jgi:hypothetical protein
MATTNVQLTKEIEDLKERVKKLEDVQRQQKQEANVMNTEHERCYKDKSIIVAGIPEEHEEKDEQRKTHIMTILSDIGANNVEILSSERIGTPREGRIRPIRIRLGNKEDRDRIINCKAKLRTSHKYCSKVFINNDIPLWLQFEMLKKRKYRKREAFFRTLVAANNVQNSQRMFEARCG